MSDMCNSTDAIASKYFTYIQNYNCPATLDSSDQLSEGIDLKPFYLVSWTSKYVYPGHVIKQMLGQFYNWVSPQSQSGWCHWLLGRRRGYLP